MRVAVVVPVRNGESMVRTCVEACRAQSRPPDELIVVDNGSTDATATRAIAAGATVVAEPVRGSFRARNTGWRVTSADVVAFTDVDCVPDRDWLRQLLSPFDDPSVAGVGGAIVPAEVRSPAQRWMVERRFLDQAFNASSAFLPFFATANAAYRRSTLEVLDGFDERFVLAGGDNDLSWRAQVLAGGRLVYCPDAAVRHVVGPRFTEVTGRWRRYTAGIVLLERRWSQWPGFPAVPGFWARLRRVWELPLALANRLRTGRPLSVAVLDAAVALSSEVGRVRGRRDVRALDVQPLRPGDRPGTGPR